ncbi:hypothetical protein I3J27_23715 [Bradyrhizobium xenonodulans]|uniref:Peptidase M41 domain-containing protein n=1 Tax=Bradyrhizobium xenonodulans TaxID=2736875 RepID=A0ABY7MF66_9BRAD|nr:hypothetical protein [Bradyrhizobium xenonodulans]WBL76032.1 hypothetical protein I3J27_23715 [Bradyrhizobium xenonodulans]
MSDGCPVEDGTAEYATCSPGTGAAAAEMVVPAAGGGPDEPPDEYDELLATLGRTEEQDQRISVHEAGHAICARLLGHEVGGVTVNPDPIHGSEGLCWGVGHSEAFSEGSGDASDVRAVISPMMPKAGEDRRPVADVFGSVYSKCIEFLAGRAAERLLLEVEPAYPVDDLRQARELALLICSSDEAIETFLAHCDVVARDLLMPHGDVLIVLSTVLRIRRTLDGREIDEIISDVVTRKAMALERRRRAEWRKSELMAARFREKCEPLDRRS